jgi:hypothetical protein
MNIVEGQMLQNGAMQCRRRRITIFIHIDPEDDGESQVNEDPALKRLKRDVNLLRSGE